MKFPIRRLDDTNLIGSDCNNYKNVYAVHFVEVLTKGSPILHKPARFLSCGFVFWLSKPEGSQCNPTRDQVPFPLPLHPREASCVPSSSLIFLAFPGRSSTSCKTPVPHDLTPLFPGLCAWAFHHAVPSAGGPTRSRLGSSRTAATRSAPSIF